MREALEAGEGEWWAEDVAAEALEPLPVHGLERDVGVEIVPVKSRSMELAVTRRRTQTVLHRYPMF